MTSYGGILSHVISFVASSDGQPVSAPDIILVVSIKEYKRYKMTTNAYVVIR